MNRIMRSLKNINGRMFLALLVMGLCPTLYTTLRTFFLGQLPGGAEEGLGCAALGLGLLHRLALPAVLEDGDNHVLHKFLCKVPDINTVRKLLTCLFEFLDDLVCLNVLEVFDQLEYVLAIFCASITYPP